MSVGRISRLTAYSRQVRWGSQLVATRRADSSQASQARQISPLPGREDPAQKGKHVSRIQQAFLQVPGIETPISRIVGTSRNDQLLIRLISS